VVRAVNLDQLAETWPAKPRLLFAYQLVLGGICMRVLSTLRLGGAIVFAGQRDIWDLIGEGAQVVAAIHKFLAHSPGPHL